MESAFRRNTRRVSLSGFTVSIRRVRRKRVVQGLDSPSCAAFLVSMEAMCRLPHLNRRDAALRFAFPRPLLPRRAGASESPVHTRANGPCFFSPASFCRARRLSGAFSGTVPRKNEKGNVLKRMSAAPFRMRHSFSASVFLPLTSVCGGGPVRRHRGRAASRSSAQERRQSARCCPPASRRRVPWRLMRIRRTPTFRQ